MKNKYFIQSNSKELRDKLESIGIKLHKHKNPIEWYDTLFISNGRYQHFPQGWPSRKVAIYVKDEEELFNYLKEEGYDI